MAVMGETQLRTATDEERRDALVGRLFQAALDTLDVACIYVGDRLGLYQALADGGAVTAAELASRSGTHERYVREWLEQQAATGILDVENLEADADARRFSLPPGHREVLLDEQSLNYLAPFMRLLVGVTRPLPALLDAFRTGGGVPYADYGVDTREGIAASNRPQFHNLLSSAWFPTVPDVHARLQADPPARVADVGCGAGWSSIAIARAYPTARVDGFDADPASVELARANAAGEGMADRVRFQVHDAAAAPPEGCYDLVTAFETLHDMARAVEALRALRAMLAPGGTVIVMDERVGEAFAAPADDVERLCYGMSVLHCLPAGLAETPSAGTGTVMRLPTLRRYAQDAGFRDVEVLPIENDFWRFYRLQP